MEKIDLEIRQTSLEIKVGLIHNLMQKCGIRLSPVPINVVTFIDLYLQIPKTQYEDISHWLKEMTGDRVADWCSHLQDDAEFYDEIQNLVSSLNETYLGCQEVNEVFAKIPIRFWDFLQTKAVYFHGVSPWIIEILVESEGTETEIPLVVQGALIALRTVRSLQEEKNLEPLFSLAEKMGNAGEELCLIAYGFDDVP